MRPRLSTEESRPHHSREISPRQILEQSYMEIDRMECIFANNLNHLADPRERYETSVRVEEPLQSLIAGRARGNAPFAPSDINHVPGPAVELFSNLQGGRMPIERSMTGELPENKENIIPIGRGPPTQLELILQPLDGSQNNFYCVTTKGAKLGRHSSNEIVVLEESVSRQHALILWEEATGRYLLKDKGSTTGTFIKVQSRLELREEYIMEMGSVQFLITHLNAQAQRIGMRVIDGPPHLLHKDYDLPVPVRIGRKAENHLCYPEDLHLSNSHSEIFLNDVNFYLEDRASTNGSWLRLSAEGMESAPFPLEEGTIFKVGTSSTYIVLKNGFGGLAQREKAELANENVCVICYEAERDTVLIPCRHQVTCLRCAKKLDACPICRLGITESWRTYK
eukprot:TRINITY_DN8286_c0_g2_i1.p1 TRINITY_DN8286_c0_g2~~TRINITY_DN8286_c0_g2_i1.p1  ORF type:complete len:395 (+),score=75.26 TRINITY_DN8286_c0_g2_i1:325-1509(+)